MIELNIRINQVAAAQAQARQRSSQENQDQRAADDNASQDSRNRPYGLIMLGEELWLDIQQHKCEYNLDHVQNCKQCAICLIDLFIDFNVRQKIENIPCDEVIQLNCNKQHVFHASCLKEWVKFQFTCPICREIVTSNTDEKKLATYRSIIKRNTLINLQNDEDNVEGRFFGAFLVIIDY